MKFIQPSKKNKTPLFTIYTKANSYFGRLPIKKPPILKNFLFPVPWEFKGHVKHNP